MSTLATITELQKMSAKELSSEIRAQQALVSKLRIEIELRKEKNSAKYRNERRQLARMETVLTQTMKKKGEEPLKAAPKSATVSARKRPSKK